MNTKKRLPRGISNCNPGNIERTKERWIGMSSDQLSDPRFVVFTSPEYGIRALMRLLIVYYERHGLTTVRQIITRWAPPNGKDQAGNAYSQNTESYIAYVAGELEVRANQDINLLDKNTVLGMTKAIIRHENGHAESYGRPHYWYDEDTYAKALVLAGFKPAQAPLSKSRTIQGAATAGAATVASGANSLFESATESVQKAAETTLYFGFLSPRTITLIFVALAIGGILAVIYARVSDQNKRLL